MEEVCKGELSYTPVRMIYEETGDKKGKADLSNES